MSLMTKEEGVLDSLEKKEKLISVLRNTLYPNAKKESVLLVIAYCETSNLDPLTKPVEIVPMNIKNSKTQQYEWRDVLMHSISYYRTRAMRTGEYIGISEPEFGEEITEILDSVQVTYPKWCKITVKRKIGKNICEFTAKEFWKENYATAGGKTSAPNSMWKKRTYGQLAKCTEAQVLRKGFPENIPAGYTREEMEGKTIDHEDIEPNNITIVSQKGNNGVRQLLGINAVQKKEHLTDKDEDIQMTSEPQTKNDNIELATTDQIGDIHDLIIQYGFSQVSIDKWLESAKVGCFEEMPRERMQKLIEGIVEKVSKKNQVED